MWSQLAGQNNQLLLQRHCPVDGRSRSFGPSTRIMRNDLQRWVERIPRRCTEKIKRAFDVICVSVTMISSRCDEVQIEQFASSFRPQQHLHMLWCRSSSNDFQSVRSGEVTSSPMSIVFLQFSRVVLCDDLCAWSQSILEHHGVRHQFDLSGQNNRRSYRLQSRR